MMIFYTLILCLSAWLVTYLLMRVGTRLEQLLSLPQPLIGGYVAFATTLAMMVVISAPSWVILLALATTLITHWQHITFIPELLAAPLLGAGAILACVLAVMGGSSLLVIHALIMLAALAGVTMATRALPEFRASANGLVALQLGLLLHAALQGAFDAS